MALNTKAIKRRIKSISSTKKITKAMEMISAVKMRRAVANALSSRNYAKLAWEIINDIAKKTDISHHPLLAQRRVKKIGMILITSNRGLAGGFTSRLITEAQGYIKDAGSKINPKIEIILSGKHGRKSVHKLGQTVVAEFDKIDLTTKIEEILPMVQLATKDYINGRYDSILVAYTDFVSAIQQVPRIKQILPLEKNPDQNVGLVEGLDFKVFENKNDAGESRYKFEPGIKRVLDKLLPRLVEMQVYQAILESDASEHSARMMAMRSASDAANDMIKELNYTFNKARQAAITQEISEIVGGAAALE